MNLTVLGNNSPFPGKDSACSGYLLRSGEIELLLDAGTGVSEKFLALSKMEKLTGIIISHLHPDHCSDLIPLKYAAQYAELTGALTEKVPVWMPVEPEMDYTFLTSTFKDGYALNKLDDTVRLSFGSLHLEFHRTAHSFPCYAMSIKDKDTRLVYTGDTGPDAALTEFARGADLLLSECSIMSDDSLRNNYTHAHLTPETAAMMAKEAGVKKLVLTHFWPYYPVEALLEEARKIFPATEAAAPYRVFEI